MIQYPTRSAVIARLARKRQPLWQAKAIQRTQYFQAVGRYIKKDEWLPDGRKAVEFWGEVKSVFVTVQYSKCAYCEIKLEASDIEWDLEHFRPKSEVAEWELPRSGDNDLVRRHFHRKSSDNRWEYQLPTGTAMPEGYYLLAYDLENYAVSCKTCNTKYKSTYFPIANRRVVHGRTVASHNSEGAHLIYPLGDQGEDPEQYIAFEGVQAVTKNASVRGQLIIDFFDLNRDSLQHSRAEWLVHTFWNTFEGFVAGTPRAAKTMEWLLSHKAPHTNCTRCFLDLCLNDRAEAEKQYLKMEKILRKSPKL